MAKTSVKNKKTTSAFSERFVEDVRKMLLEQKIKLEKDLGGFAKKNPNVDNDYDSNFPDYGDKDDENAAEVAQYVVNLSLEQQLEKSLRDVANALKRIEKGGFGMCKYCGKAIEEKRILARPTSSSCMSCKKAIKQEV